MPHQEQLILGIDGEIRTRLAKYRSKRATGRDCFPCIDSLRDNFGNVWTPTSQSISPTNLRVGDRLDVVVTASDPEGREIEFWLEFGSSAAMTMVRTKSARGELSVTIGEEHIGEQQVDAKIVSSRSFHRWGAWDDRACFRYLVLPSKI
jgi:hypothetical protein